VGEKAKVKAREWARKGRGGEWRKIEWVRREGGERKGEYGGEWRGK